MGHFRVTSGVHRLSEFHCLMPKAPTHRSRPRCSQNYRQAKGHGRGLCVSYIWLHTHVCETSGARPWKHMTLSTDGCLFVSITGALKCTTPVHILHHSCARTRRFHQFRIISIFSQRQSPHSWCSCPLCVFVCVCMESVSACSTNRVLSQCSHMGRFWRKQTC